MLARHPRHGLLAGLLALVAFASFAVALTARGGTALPAQTTNAITAGDRPAGDDDDNRVFAGRRERER